MRIILDTNIWRYLLDADALKPLHQLSRQRKLTVMLPPATAFEMARTVDSALRVRMITAILNPEWQRMMPEAYTESLEIVNEIRRCRPQWMLPTADKHRFQPLFRDWKAKNGFWRRLKEQPEVFSDVLKSAVEAVHPAAVRQAYGRREDFMAGDLTMTAHLDSWEAELKRPRTGWNGDKVGAWRAETMNAMEHALSDQRNP